MKPLLIIVFAILLSQLSFAEETLPYLSDHRRFPPGQHALGYDWEGMDPTLRGLESGKLGRKPASFDEDQFDSYQGGGDEQPIKVQEKLPSPTRYWTHQMVYREVVRELESEENNPDSSQIGATPETDKVQ